MRQLALSRLAAPATDSLPADTTVVVALRVRWPLPAAEQQRLAAWLRVRAGSRRPVQLLVTAEDGPRPSRPARRRAAS